ncbi:MAG: MATE family efflux transporter [Erysipelotrichaceae bacterium]|nr:MATE family efflux transporter [Erysipelotrichaceae bacterium]
MNDLNNTIELFLKLLPIQIFVNLASSLSRFVNGLIIGNNLSASAMIASGLVSPLFNIIGSISTIVSTGAGILCGNYMGKGDSKKVDQVFSVSMILLSVLGVLLTAICFFFAEPLAVLLRAEQSVIPETVSYIRGVSLGILPLLILPCLMTFLQMCNKSGISLIATIVLAVLNAILDLLAIRVWKGNVFGVGAAASLSQLITMLGLIVYFRIRKNLVSFCKEKPDRKMIIDILKYGSPASLAGILYSVRNIFLNSYASSIGGKEAVNAMAILGSFGGFLDAFNVGVGNTLTMLASVFIGERDSGSLKRLMKITAVIGLSLCLFKFLIVYPFGKNIAVLFGAYGSVIDLSKQLLVFYAWCAPFNIFTLILMGVYQSLGRVKLCNMIYPVNCIFVPLFCCAILSKVLGIKAIWLSYTIAEIITLSVFYLTAVSKRKKPILNLDDLLGLPEEFNTENKYSISVKKLSEVVEVSRKIETFCQEKGIDKRRSMFAGLCMEEMAGNIVEHGFEKDRKENTIDIFACVEDGEVSLRLRDNCVPFDPNSRVEMFNPADPCKNIGIRMVSRIAKEMNYHINFGMNILTVRL